MIATYESRSHPGVGCKAADERAERSRLRKWDRMSRRGVDSYLKNHPDDFWRRVQRGIPPEYRWAVWKARLLPANAVPSSREAQEREKALFSGSPTASGCLTSLLGRESSWHKQIVLDSSRSFDDIRSFTEEHEKSLCRVLNAYAFLNPEVGYAEGMGFVGGILLLTSECSEPESLLALVELMEDCGLNGFYSQGSPLLEKYELMFDRLLENLMPDLRCHFANENVQTADYVHLWFLSLFAYCLPLETALLVWDIIMCKGLPHLILAALALLSSVEEVLLAKQHEEILEFFSDMKLAEDKETAAEVGRCLTQKIGRLSKMAHVQRILGSPEMPAESAPAPERSKENSRSKFHAHNSEKQAAQSFAINSKKEKRVSFSFDTNIDHSSTINWYLQ